VLPILRQEGIKLEPSGPLTILPFKLKLMWKYIMWVNSVDTT
jgi:hypothetical protein